MELVLGIMENSAWICHWILAIQITVKNLMEFDLELNRKFVGSGVHWMMAPLC